MAITQQVRLPSRGSTTGPLDVLMSGLKIASGIYGIKTAEEQAEARELQREMDKRNLELKEQAGQRAERQAIASEKRQEELLGLEKDKIAFQKEIAERKYKSDVIKKQADIFAKEAEKEVKSQDRTFTKVQSLGKRYDQASKTSREAIEGFQKVESAATTPNPSGASDMTLLFGYLKSIDPGSTIRESEFRAASETQPIPERIEALRQKLLSGDLLAPEQRKRILLESKRAVFNQLKLQNNINNRFKNIAENFQIDPDLIIDPIFGEFVERFSKEVDVVAGLQKKALQTEIKSPAPEEKSLQMPVMQATYGGGYQISPTILPKAAAQPPSPPSPPSFVNPPPETVTYGGRTVTTSQQDRKKLFLQQYLRGDLD